MQSNPCPCHDYERCWCAVTEVADRVVGPIERSSTYALEEGTPFDDIRYIRLNNTPTQRRVEGTLAALEAADPSRDDALVTPSGTSAIHLALSALLRSGEELLLPRQVYGGTKKIADELQAREGVVVREYDAGQGPPSSSASGRVLYVEAMSNPWLRVPDLRALAAFARSRGMVSVIDATLVTPALLRPRTLGYDLVVHSASKALNGHSDLVAGVIAGDAERIRSIRHLANRWGICPDPQTCFLLERGLKTLAIRMDAQCASALRVAEFLQSQPSVERVTYPGLTNHPDHERAQALLGRGGTMVAFECPTAEAAQHVCAATTMFRHAPSLGGVESLICRPVGTSHAGLPEAARARMQVRPTMVRLSIGLEDPRDLEASLAAALP